MATNHTVLLRSAMVAYDELRREFNRRQTLAILAEVGKRNAQGRPFKGLPGSDEPRELETRTELAPAINMYHALLERRPEEVAYQVARRIILNSSLIHLRSIYPNFEGGDFLAMAGGDGNTVANELNTEFAFADTRLVEMSKEKSSFDVVHCRIPGCLKLANASRLAPIFCEVDSIYFPIFEPRVNLVRTKTIIRGGDVCDFRLTWK